MAEDVLGHCIGSGLSDASDTLVANILQICLQPTSFNSSKWASPICTIEILPALSSSSCPAWSLVETLAEG